MPHSPILLIHIVAGTVGLLSGTAAVVFRKGGPRHAFAGKIFVASMLIMASVATYLAILKDQPSNITGGIFTFYLIATAWLTARRGDGQTSRFDWVLLLVPTALGIFTWMHGVSILRGGANPPDGVPAGMSLFMGTVMLLAAAGDVRMTIAGGITGKKRIARHLWRMCFGLFIAAGSFFLGPSNRPLRLLSATGLGKHLSPAFFTTGVYLTLTLLPLILLVYWMARIRFTKFYNSVSAMHPEIEAKRDAGSAAVARGEEW